MVLSSFGTFLHNIRIRTNGTQLARNSGISYVYLLDIEKGARPVPSNNVLKALADNLSFSQGEREKFFDLAAKEKREAPIDVVDYLGENEELIKIIRRLKQLSPENNYWRIMAQHIQNDLEEEISQ